MSRGETKPISLGTQTTESLRYPHVYYPGHYGAFVGFAESIDQAPSLCACSIRAFNAYLAVRSQVEDTPNGDPLRNAPLASGAFPRVLAELSMTQGPDAVVFAEDLCHRCSMKVPSVRWCHEMYGGVFKQTYGWYIQQAMFKFGLDGAGNPIVGLVVDEVADLAWRRQELLARYNETSQHEAPPKEERRFLSSEMAKLHRKVLKEVENEVRTEFGMRKVGDRWVSETILFAVVESLLPGVEVVRHHRPKWLEGLELDIWIPSMNLGIEYQGQQHYKPVEAWGGKAALDALRERDQRKRRLCEQHGVTLNEVTFRDPLTEEFVRCVLQRQRSEFAARLSAPPERMGSLDS